MAFSPITVAHQAWIKAPPARLTRLSPVQIGDVFNQYWGVVFGEATDIRQRDECEIFHCQSDSSRLMSGTVGPLIQLCDAWAGGNHPPGICAGV